MGSFNRVIDGDYLDSKIGKRSGTVVLKDRWDGQFTLDHHSVEAYQRVDTREEKKGYKMSNKSFLGGLFLGPFGALLGLEKETVRIHKVAVKFKDGKKSLLELDDELYTKLLEQIRDCS
ncbi:hypothetical protein [Salisediminibacterium beveridgei]|uniref:Uncharacterized protein n=1 Tax=Salisediminibacterium beveridgei TaxID=632773 RepID=A0A1D7QT57_9BACI|nr:hypothetical protein [Salisediminibacterium beveridgei]AOM82216.1 hypothetical protein BBEV_0845 [Salisediminibacterium beveridgei]